MKRSKVLIGLSNIANISFTLSQALRFNKIKADFVSLKFSDRIFSYNQEKVIFQFKKNIFPILFNKNTTSIINTIILYIFFLIYLIKYNTFIFISPGSFLPNNHDLPILKFFGKKIVFIFAGCPERDINFMPGNLEYICNRCEDENKKNICLCYNVKRKQILVRKLEYYADYIIAQDDSASYLKHKNAIWFYGISMYPDGNNYIQKFQNDRIKIVHFPSNSKIKLSNIIIPVLEQIKKENSNVDIIIKSGISNDKVMQYLSESHILVDALGLGYGVLAVEAMAHGCIVVTGEMDFIEKAIPNNPVIKSTSKTLYVDLTKLISDRKRMINFAQKSIEFFNQYHSFHSAGAYYKDNLDLT